MSEPIKHDPSTQQPRWLHDDEIAKRVALELGTMLQIYNGDDALVMTTIREMWTQTETLRVSDPLPNEMLLLHLMCHVHAANAKGQHPFYISIERVRSKQGTTFVVSGAFPRIDARSVTV